MKHIIRVAISLFVLCAGASAESVCSTHTIRGSWGVTCEGNLSPAENAPLSPIRILGTCTSTIDGVFTCEATVSLGGMILTQTMTGKANVDENCTGTVKYTQKLNGGPAPDMNIRFLIFDNGKTIKGQPVDRGSNLACTLTKM
jgi:hypothetical protein